jgi:hypothetical protein
MPLLLMNKGFLMTRRSAPNGVLTNYGNRRVTIFGKSDVLLDGSM